MTKTVKKTGPVAEKEKDKPSVDKSDYLVGTPHDLLQRKRVAKKGKE